MNGNLVIIRLGIAFLSMLMFTMCNTGDNVHSYEAETAERASGVSENIDKEASGGTTVELMNKGQFVCFRNLPTADKIAIRYATENVGVFSLSVDSQPGLKVNIHSSGSFEGSFLYAVVDVNIPRNGSVTLSVEEGDVALCIDKILVGKGDFGLPPDIWNLPKLEVAKGPFVADWDSLSNYYSAPDWWREAKFGAWSHWDPQSMPEYGDWYARNMYIEGHWQYNYHVEHFGHPSEYGYKDICNDWVIDKWNPEELMKLYMDMGARYFMAMGGHHDNFDCYDSKYQPWNSVRVGPKMDIIGIWEKVARSHKMRFGIGFHSSPPRTWGQFMTVRYTADRDGDKAGVPYDAMQTFLDGKGKWWEGMDPADLYGPEHDVMDPLLSPFANQFMWRVDDAITKYHPDMIYFDESAGDSYLDLGVNMGLGFLAPPLIANYYNKSMTWNNGKLDVVFNAKGVGGRYNSFPNNPALIPIVERAMVKSTEFYIESEIMAYPFQTERSLSDWHYKKGAPYAQADEVIWGLMENVSRNGSLLLNIPQHGRGDVDEEAVRICHDIGAWLKINGEAVYGSRPFEVWGDHQVLFTRNGGYVYATLLNWNDSAITLKALHSGGTTVGDVTEVVMLGSDIPFTFTQNADGLMVKPSGEVLPLAGIENASLSSRYRVLRISHTKGWMNDDDPGVTATGWKRYCNLNSGDYNNDLTVSERVGDVWSCSFEGKGFDIIAPKEQGAGSMEILIDGNSHSIVDLSTVGERLPQRVVCQVANLAPGKHTLSIINRKGKVAVDALCFR